jgi:hypothetical protein
LAPHGEERLTMPKQESTARPPEEEDLFDFAGTKDAIDTTAEDELDVEQFLAAVGAATEEDQQPQTTGSGLGVSEAVLREVAGMQSALADKPAAPSAPATNPSAAEPARQRPVPTLQRITVSGAALPRPVWIAGLALLGVNAIGLGVALLQQGQTAEELERARQKLEQAAEGVGADLRTEIERFERGTAQATSAALESGVSLQHVERSLEDHDYALARRQLYSLLSTIDRLPAERRASLEARANFMLADSYRLEGFHRADEEVRR